MPWPPWPFPRREEHPPPTPTVADHGQPNLPARTSPTAWDCSLNKTDWSHYTTTQTIVISAITTATTLALIKLYKTYLRRIPSSEYLKPGFFRRRSFYGYVTRVGDGDGFHLFHTPGGRLMGWGWARHRRPKDMVQRAAKGKGGQTISVRIAGIDAPEAAHFGNPAQPYAKEALEWLKGAILHKYVRVYPFRQDQYQRIVASVYRRRFWFFRTDVGLQMLKRGLATVYEGKVFREFGGNEEKYVEAEKRAKDKQIGMWDKGLLNRLLSRESTAETPREYKKRMAQKEKFDKTADMAK